MSSNLGLRPNGLAIALAIVAAIPLALPAPAESAAPGNLTSEEVLVVHRGGSSFEPALTVGRDGNIYGTAPDFLFRIDAAGAVTIVHQFTERGFPSRLIVGQDGMLYGFTEQADIANPEASSIFFRLDSQQVYTPLQTLPTALSHDLVQGSDGAFYSGTATIAGGETMWNDGGLIKMTAGTYSVLGGLAALTSPKPMLIGTDGALYGTRLDNGGNGGMSLFRVDVAGNLTIINSQSGIGNLTLGSDGLLYAITGSASQYYGAISRFNNSGNATVLHNLTAPDGTTPVDLLTVGQDGAIYGLSTYGGNPIGGGTVFRVDTAGVFSVVHAFTTGEGGVPENGLLLAKDGALYAPMLSNYTVRVDGPSTTTYFSPQNMGGPATPYVQGSDCALYGVGLRFQNAQDGDQPVVYRVFEPGHLCQRIEFDALPDRTLGEPSFALTATASSGLPVSFNASGRCTLTGDQVFLKNGVGICRVTASQIGDSRFESAETVTQEFRVWSPRRMGRFE